MNREGCADHKHYACLLQSHPKRTERRRPCRCRPRVTRPQATAVHSGAARRMRHNLDEHVTASTGKTAGGRRYVSPAEGRFSEVCRLRRKGRRNLHLWFQHHHDGDKKGLAECDMSSKSIAVPACGQMPVMEDGGRDQPRLVSSRSQAHWPLRQPPMEARRCEHMPARVRLAMVMHALSRPVADTSPSWGRPLSQDQGCRLPLKKRRSPRVRHLYLYLQLAPLYEPPFTVTSLTQASNHREVKGT
jgi:hypothetical protein